MRVFKFRAPPQAQPPSNTLTTIYKPVVRGYLLAAALYYCVITISHLLVDHGTLAVVLVLLSGLAAISCFAARWMVGRPDMTYGRLELAALVANAYMLANVVVNQVGDFDEHRQIYFVIMALGFAIVGPSRRVMYPSILLALGGLLALASKSEPGVALEDAFVGLAGCFGAVSVSTLLRGAVMRELEARLSAEVLNGQLTGELERNAKLSQSAQDLMRKAEAANLAKTEFLVTVSHELRTPLNGVLGMAQAMANDPLPDIQRPRLETLQASGRVLQGLINDVLDISSLEAGRLELSPVTFDTRTFAGDLRDHYSALAAEKGLGFKLLLEPEAAGWRRGDEFRIRQVLVALLDNALKFTPAGSVMASLSQDGEMLVARVIDTGVGIAPDAAPMLFERFSQADASATRPFGGVGLGLAISREILERMGGEIGFTSTPGEGSSFTVRAPLARVAAPAAAVTPHAATADPATGADMTPLRLLVVDDNPTNRLVMQTLLVQCGIGCEVVDNGVEAVESWGSGEWDAILMDIHMPRMDGRQASAEIRRLEATVGRARTPIIAVTASVQSHEIESYVAAGMDDCVAKPVVLWRLLEALDKVVDVSAANDAQVCDQAAGKAALA